MTLGAGVIALNWTVTRRSHLNVRIESRRPNRTGGLPAPLSLTLLRCFPDTATPDMFSISGRSFAKLRQPGSHLPPPRNGGTEETPQGQGCEGPAEQSQKERGQSKATVERLGRGSVTYAVMSGDSVAVLAAGLRFRQLGWGSWVETHALGEGYTLPY